MGPSSRQANYNLPIVNVNCKCRTGAIMHSVCAERWFMQKMEMRFTQEHPEDADSRKVANNCRPHVDNRCDICHTLVSEEFSRGLLSSLAKHDVTSNIILKCIKEDEPLEVQVTQRTLLAEAAESLVRRREIPLKDFAYWMHWTCEPRSGGVAAR